MTRGSCDRIWSSISTRAGLLQREWSHQTHGNNVLSGCSKQDKNKVFRIEKIRGKINPADLMTGRTVGWTVGRLDGRTGRTDGRRTADGQMDERTGG